MTAKNRNVHCLYRPLTYILAAVLWTALIGGIYSLWIASQILHATH